MISCMELLTCPTSPQLVAVVTLSSRCIPKAALARGGLMYSPEPADYPKLRPGLSCSSNSKPTFSEQLAFSGRTLSLEGRICLITEM